MLDNVGLRYPHRASGAKAPRTLRPLPLLRFAVSATGGAHLCSIQYYLRFWLSSCRTSLAVSALRIMRYCLRKSVCLHCIFNVFYSTVTTGAHIVCPPTWRHINANAKTSHILTSRTHSKQPWANDVRPYQDIYGNTAQFPPYGLSTAPAAAARHLRCQNAR